MSASGFEVIFAHELSSTDLATASLGAFGKLPQVFAWAIAGKHSGNWKSNP